MRQFQAWIQSARCEKTLKKKKINSLSIENVTNGEISKSQHENTTVLVCEVITSYQDSPVERVYFVDHLLKEDLICMFWGLNFDTFCVKRFILVSHISFLQQ